MTTSLTIAIPTHNRSKCLDEQLRRVTQQVAKLDSIDILVSDNASNDNTQQIVDNYREKYKFIT